MDHLTLSLASGAVAGALSAIPMLAQKMPFGSCLAAFCTYLFAGILIFRCDLPYLPWWADGMGVTLMMAIPQVLNFSGKDRRAAPMVLLNALLLGFLISVAERCLA